MARTGSRKNNRFARAAGYHKITLWTHSVLTAARHVYQGAGFQLVQTESHEKFGKKTMMVQVADNDKKEVNFSFSANDKAAD